MIEPSLPRIVLVDSKTERRAVLRSILVLALGPTSVVAQAADRIEALQAVGTTEANAVILDLDMPHNEGVETIACLREAYPSLVLVVCTFGHHATTRRQATDAGADAYLAKPVTLEQIRTINRLVGDRNGPVPQPT